MADETKVFKKTKDHTDIQILPIERTQASTFQSIYANNAQVSITFFDISIAMGEVAGISDSAMKVIDKVMIRMSPEHAESLWSLLGGQIEAYKKSFGELRKFPGT